MSPPWRADFADSAPFHHVAADAALLTGADWPTLEALNVLAEGRGLRNAAGRPLRFAAQHVRCGQGEYEAGILAEGLVPSRECNWHDLLNALTWLTFPRAKAALNALQCEELEARRGAPRGPKSDAATLFDESGLLLIGRDGELARLLAQRRWEEAFVARRQDWEGMRAYVFGHAVLEKLLAPWPGITAKCLFLQVETLPDSSGVPDWLDAALAAAWEGGGYRCPADLFPVPVLGLPGWWAANEEAGFYGNRLVFRPGASEEAARTACGATA